MRLVDGRLRLSASDAAGFLACRHLTRLEAAAAHGLVQKPYVEDIGFEALEQRGEAHETEVLEGSQAQGWSILEITDPFEDLESAVAETEGALRDGVDVIYQAALLRDDRIGYPDFLVRAQLLGGTDGYEVVDAKLARTATARAVFQSAFYSRLLAQVTGIEPKRMHLALGGNEPASFDVAAFGAYERQVSGLMAEFIEAEPVFPPADTYPDPVEHCAICRWRLECIARRRTDDDLSLVAGITSRQRKALKEQGVETRRGFAELDPLPRLDGVGEESLARTQAQARIQVAGEDAAQHLWELIEPERDRDDQLVRDRGLLALPEPAEGDLFFDIEGARYYSEDGAEFGLQYLFGLVDTTACAHDGRPAYRAFWAFDRKEEREAFKQLMDFLASHLHSYPHAHIYHYNHYEPTSIEHLSELHLGREDVLRQLMGRFATREDELDNLLRRRVFVDLYRVVRQGVRASVESYSLKRLEPFFGYERKVPLEDVNERMVAFEISLDEGTAGDDADSLALIAGYNEDDCRATLALRDWLEERRSDLEETMVSAIPRPEPPEVDEETTDLEIQELRDALLGDLPDDGQATTPEQAARILVADLLEYHRREDKPAWWRYFHLHDLTDEELRGEQDAISGLQFDGDVGPYKRSQLYRYRYPAQEHGFSDGDRAEDPATGQRWSLVEVNDSEGYLEIARGPTKLEEPHPSALIQCGPEYTTTDHRESLRSLARRVIGAGDSEWPRSPYFDLLLRRRPNTDNASAGPLSNSGEDAVEAGRRLALNLDSSCLPIQGPPGTGKTYLGANQIIDLIEKGNKVGVTAMSHAVICNMLDEVSKVALERETTVRIGQRPGSDDRWVNAAASDAELLFRTPQAALDALTADEVDVLGATTWVWTRPDFEEAVDVLVIDEAGQMSMADVLASARSARNLILLGDPLQLAHPRQGSHPPTVPGSALEHVLEGRATMPNDRGLFIGRTRRMHPDITRFTSEVFYEDRLRGIDELDRQEVLCEGRFTGSGLRVVDVEHEANSNSAPEEAAAVVSITQDLLSCRWRDSSGEEHGLTETDVLVITPFNAQIREIKQALDAATLERIQVGTVDKFQGRQAPVVIYSTASSTAEDAPRGMAFLYDLHRLNVATSRAQCMAIVVTSPELVRVFCRTPRQMQLANALCRLREFASTYE